MTRSEVTHQVPVQGQVSDPCGSLIGQPLRVYLEVKGHMTRSKGQSDMKRLYLMT